MTIVIDIVTNSRSGIPHPYPNRTNPGSPQGSALGRETRN